jgi:ubiquinone/menaquinone biosynthesis C-methylase UbiE
MKSAQVIQDQYRDSRNLEARIRLHRLFSTNTYGWYRWYLDQLDIPENARILELGCGPGALWQGNTSRLPADARLTLTDYSSGMARQASQHIIDTRFSFAAAGAQSIPFPSAAFDLVLANHMLYHVLPSPDAAIAEIRRVLKPGGRLYAATNGRRHMSGMDELVLQIAPQFSTKIHLPGFAESFTLENGENQLARHFQHLRLECYPDGLNVTQAQPFVDYVLSMPANGTRAPSAQEIELFLQCVQDHIDNHGPIQISKESGVWIAA